MSATHMAGDGSRIQARMVFLPLGPFAAGRVDDPTVAERCTDSVKVS
jgi:hypothetical protein